MDCLNVLTSVSFPPDAREFCHLVARRSPQPSAVLAIVIFSEGVIAVLIINIQIAGFERLHNVCLAACPAWSLTGTILIDTCGTGLDCLSKNQVRETRPTIQRTKGSFFPGVHSRPLLSSNGRLVPHSCTDGSLLRANVFVAGFS